MSLEAIQHYLVTALTLTVPVSGLVFLWRGYYLKKHHKVFVLRNELPLAAFIFYFICLYSITVFREDISFVDMLTRRHELEKVNLVPLVEMLKLLEYGYIWSFTYNFIGNIVWFIPLGFFIPILMKRIIKGYQVTLIGMAVSLSIEVLQFLCVTGIADVDDILFNTLGTLCGVWLWRIMRRLYYRYKRRR